MASSTRNPRVNARTKSAPFWSAEGSVVCFDRPHLDYSLSNSDLKLEIFDKRRVYLKPRQLQLLHPPRGYAHAPPLGSLAFLLRYNQRQFHRHHTATTVPATDCLLDGIKSGPALFVHHDLVLSVF